MRRLHTLTMAVGIGLLGLSGCAATDAAGTETTVAVVIDDPSDVATTSVDTSDETSDAAGSDAAGSEAIGDEIAVLTSTSAEASADAAAALAANAADHDDADDQEWDEATEMGIVLAGDTATTTAASGVAIEGSTVTITAAGTYRLSGALTDGQIVVNTDGEGTVRLVLDGIDVHSSTTAPVAVLAADEVVVVLAAGTENVLTDSSSYVFVDAETDEPNATLFSAADLTITGSGSLTVEAAYNDGIASKDGLVIAGGTIVVTAVDDGVRGKDYVVVDGGSLTVEAGGDGVKSDNDEDGTKGYIAVNSGTIGISAGGDAMQATTDVIVVDGVITATAGGGSSASVGADDSAKGLKGTVSVIVAGGQISIDAADDAIHSDNSVVIGGGTLRLATADDAVHADASLAVNGGVVDVVASYEGLESASIAIAGGDISVVASDDGINAGGSNEGILTIAGGTILVDANGDGVDVNGSITMTAGTLLVNGPTEQMNGPLDYHGTFDISGGIVVAAGSSGMAMAPTSTSSQLSLLSTFDTQAAGTVVHIQSTDGSGVVTFAPSKPYASIAVSVAGLATDVTYEVSVGGSTSGTALFGLYDADDHSGGTLVATTTTADAASSRRPGGRGR